MGGFTAALQRFGIGRLAALAGVAAGVAAVLVVLMLRVGESPSALLYSNLDLREAGEVTAALDQAGITYEARADGSTILVNRDDVGTARLMLAEQGLVTSGSVGYELFDAQSALGQTEFQQNMNRKRAIEGEIARTLMSMRGVNSARVLIALPERQLFQAEAAPVTASVSIDTGGREMTSEEIQAVQQLVSTAVTGLRPDRVTIVDANNRLLAAGGEGEGFSAAVASERRTEIEHRLQATLLNLVEGVVGPGAARVQVTAEIDESRQTIQAQEFNPDGQVVRSTSSQESNSSDSQGSEGGTVGVEEQLPEGAGTAAAGQGPSSTSGETGETTNYEISNTVTTTVREPGTIQRLSVAVAVDGVVTPPANGEGEAAYAPRSEEDMQRIQQLVRSAMGFNETRGDQVEVVNVRFARPDGAVVGGTEAAGGMFDFDRNDIMRAIELGVLLIVGALMIFFVLRPLVKAASGGGAAGPTIVAGAIAGPGGGTQAGPGAAMAQGMPALPPSEMDHRLDIARIEGQVKASSVRKVSEFVESHPDESTAILRGWVHES